MCHYPRTWGTGASRSCAKRFRLRSQREGKISVPGGRPTRKASRSNWHAITIGLNSKKVRPHLIPSDQASPQINGLLNSMVKKSLLTWQTYGTIELRLRVPENFATIPSHAHIQDLLRSLNFNVHQKYFDYSVQIKRCPAALDV